MGGKTGEGKREKRWVNDINFSGPGQKASPSRYERIHWYPGQAAVERKRQAYLNEHPQIKFHSDQLLPDAYDTSDDGKS
jgi:hypothetical protein